MIRFFAFLTLLVGFGYCAFAHSGFTSPPSSLMAGATSQGEDSPEAALNRIRTHIKKLLNSPQPALYERHLNSVLAVCEEDVLGLQFAGSNRKSESKELLGYLKTIENGLNDDGSSAAPYLVDGRRSLTLARLSQSDNSIQFYLLSLPPHWDANKPYPLYVQLHGAGPVMPSAYVNFTFSPHTEDEKPAGERIVIVPWMRGNHPWREGGEAETDIWEAIDDLKTFAKLDPDRWYISGHSMGGDDVWALVQRTPDLWAAAGILAGSPNSAPADLGLVANMNYVPFYVWVNEHDPIKDRRPFFYEFQRALSAVGDPPKAVMGRGATHMYSPEDAAALENWLLTHVRHRPNHFVFVADTALHRGVWGITVPRKYSGPYPVAEPRAKFECWLEDQTVRVNTWGATSIGIDFGPLGLRMSGNIKLILNGEPRFKGPVPQKTVSLTILHPKPIQ